MTRPRLPVRLPRSRAALIAWVFVPSALLLGAVALLNFAVVGRVAEDLAADRSEAQARLLAAQLSDRLMDMAQPLNALAANTDATLRNALPAARGSLWSFDAGVLLLNTDGQVWLADDRRDDQLGADWSAMGLSLPRLPFDPLTASDVLHLEGPRTPVVALLVPRSQSMDSTGGALVGLVSVSQDHARMSDFYRAIKGLLFDADGTIYLIDSTGTVLFHPDTWQIGTVQQPRTGRSHNAAGRERLISMAVVPGTGWSLVIEEHWANLTAAAAPYQWLLILLLVLGLLLPAVLIWAALRNVAAYEAARAQAAAAERQRLARDLHDAVSQTLFAAAMISGVLPRLWERDPQEAAQQLNRLNDLTRAASSEMRTLLLELRPDALLQTSLPELLHHLVQALSGREKLMVTFEAADLPDLPTQVKVALYRIAQEALNNIAKHAEAQSVVLRLFRDDDCVRLLVQDDGRGFDADSIPPGRLGQQTMQERAMSVGAGLRVYSAPGQGTTVSLCWPDAEEKGEV